MDGPNGLKETAPVASNLLSVNVFYGPGEDYGRRAAKALRRSVRL
jgi:hypothetical protein